MNSNELQFPNCQSPPEHRMLRSTVSLPLGRENSATYEQKSLESVTTFFPSCSWCFKSFSLPFTFHKAQRQQKLPHSVIFSCLSFISSLISSMFLPGEIQSINIFGSFLCVAFSLSLPKWALMEFFLAQMYLFGQYKTVFSTFFCN